MRMPFGYPNSRSITGSACARGGFVEKSGDVTGGVDGSFYVGGFQGPVHRKKACCRGLTLACATCGGARERCRKTLNEVGTWARGDKGAASKGNGRAEEVPRAVERLSTFAGFAPQRLPAGFGECP